MSLPRIPADLHGRELWLMLARDQFGRKLSAEVDSMLLDTFKDVVRRIIVDGRNLTPRQNDRLAELFRSTSAMLADKYGSVSSTVTAALGEFSSIEAAIARQELALRVGSIGGLTAEFRGLSPDRVLAIADVLVEGQRLPDWWRDQARRMSGQVRRQMQIGLTLGESVSDIVKRIVPPRGSVEPSVYARARREATTLVRTASTAVSAQARLEELRRMDPRISDRYQWVAVRDARTTPICRALDGKQFRYDDPKAPLPPAHFACRSSITAVIKRKDLGIGEPKEAGPGGWKDYDAWLRAQPEDVQRKILGAGRWDLWRSGKVSLQDMVDSDRRTLTLDQLRALVPPAPVPVAAQVPAFPKPSERIETTDPKLQALLTRSMAALDELHHVPATMSRLSATLKTLPPDARGQFVPSRNAIEVNRAQPNPLTVVHEFGHALDAQAFGDVPARPGLYDSLEYWFATHRAPASPAERQFRDAIRASAHYAVWSHPTMPRQFRVYMTKPTELFARAYEQWVYTRLPAGHPLRTEMQPRFDEKAQKMWFWEPGDFKPIADAMDALFKERGWLK